jgi:hypothetical protein
MKRSMALLMMLLGCCSGCAAMEDFMIGPDPAIPMVGQATGSCGVPITNVAASQTAEPELLR